jgi:hypothetical protein
MAISTESFQSLLDSARVGELQLPEFQRDWVWNRSQVVQLFDSLRQKYPIGALLVMERNTDVPIVARPFVGTEEVAGAREPDSFVLDGQQRITSGLALYYGLGGSQYFLNLNLLYKLATDQKVDFRSPPAVRGFLEDLDPEEAAYCIGRKSSKSPETLIGRGLLYTGALQDSFALDELLDEYLKTFPERSAFVRGVVRDGFRLGADVHVPVTKIEKGRPVEAVSRIFATLNTTGRPLNSFELVVAILYPAGIRLRSDIDENRLLAPHYSNMDRTGEVFLQTIAMLAGFTPKKAQLPRTIKPERYRAYRNEALELLENLGRFLTERLGVGLDSGPSLVPYDSIFAPMALSLAHVDGMKLKGADRAKADRKLEKWFVAAALANRYQEGVHNKQVRDREDVIRWLEEGDAAEPVWIQETRVTGLRNDTPDGAIGRLLRCLINRRGPKDPISGKDVGERLGAVQSAKHHIFPTRWVDKYLKDWDPKKDVSDLGLNVSTISQETNLRWLNVDPANQLIDILEASASPAAMAGMLRAHYIDEKCVEILRRPDKTKVDFNEFLVAREACFLQSLADEWGILAADSPTLGEDDEDLTEEAVA